MSPDERCELADQLCDKAGAPWKADMSCLVCVLAEIRGELVGIREIMEEPR